MNKQAGNKVSTLLIGSYGRGNIGDDAFLMAALELFPDHKLYINSANDDLLCSEIKSRVKTIATGSLRDIAKKVVVFCKVKSIVYCGGDLWVELYGSSMPRRSLYKMVLLNFTARLFGKRIYYLGCGVGKLSGYSLWLARLSARFANGILVREQRSAKILDLPHVKTGTDLTVNLTYFKKKAFINKQKNVIGISILYYIPRPEINFPRKLDALAEFIQSLPKEKFTFILLPMLVSEQTPNDDLWASKQLQDRLPKHDIKVFVSRHVKECINILSDIDFLIGARLHANILATLSGTPCIGLAYRPKVASFFRDNGLGEFCLDLSELNRLKALFWHMHDNYAQTAQLFANARKRNLDERLAYQDFVQSL